MGRDKALLPFGHQPLLAWPVAVLRTAGATDVWVIGPERAELGELGIRALPEPHPGRGPLPALAHGLAVAEAHAVPTAVVLGCDMPFVTVDVVRTLAAAAAEYPATAVVAITSDGRWQPLLAAYPSSWASGLASAGRASTGAAPTNQPATDRRSTPPDRSVVGVLRRRAVVTVRVDDEMAASLDTPELFHAAAARLRPTPSRTDRPG
jgi:molybdopterin-guanine dinucleotide biosynthesis protein A